MKRFLLFCILWLAHNTAPIHAEGSEIPFLYYYSADKQAFIAERADGSDSQILAHYQLPKENIVTSKGEGYLSGPGWSASGKWFAWTHLLRNGIPSENAYLVERDGSTLRHLIDNQIVVNMQWQPGGDLLLLQLWTERAPDVGNEVIRVYDPNTDIILIDTTVNQLFGNKRQIEDLSWSPEGDSIAVADAETVKTIDLSSRRTEGTKSSAEHNPDCASGKFIQWLDNKRLAYVNPTAQELVIQSVLSNTQVAAISITEGNLLGIDWSPDYSHALIYMQDSANTLRSSLWLLSLDSKSIRLVNDDVALQSGCVSEHTAWGNNQQAIFVTKSGNIWLMSTESNEAHPIAVPIHGAAETLSPIRWINNDLVFLWNVPGLNGKQIYRYNLQTNTTTLLIPSTSSQVVQTEFISEPHNGEFIYNGNIVGAANGFQREIFHYGSEHGSLEFSTKAVLWHPSGDWVIALSGDSRDDLLGVYVGQTDGSFQRRLSTCLDKAFACYGWLPDTNNRNL